MNHTVEYASTFGGGYTADGDLYADMVRFRCAPGTPQATLSRRYGFFAENDGTREVSALDLRGKFIRIKIYDDSETIYWHGYCAAQDDNVYKTFDSDSGTVHSGKTTHSRSGLEYFLR